MGRSPNRLQQNSDVKVVTFGCRLNTFESQVMESHAKNSGLEKTIIVNTCAVTNEAERQAKQTIRKLGRENPDHNIIVTGCAAQISPLTYGQLPGVTRVIGNHEKMLPESYTKDASGIHVSNIMEVKETAHHLVESMIEGDWGKARAFIQIQNGCNHRCTFCTIPYGRGNNRSVPVAQLIEQVRKLVESGTKEIILTGVDITDYGADLPGNPTLGQLVARMLAHVPELQRLRLSSLDPVEVDEHLYQEITTNKRILPHFHISLQAGNDVILRRMKRRHLRKDIIDFCTRVRQARPEAVFGADIIAGFPTETDEQFADSLSIIKECDITHVHAFSFSPKAGTPAAKMPQLDRGEIKERTRRLRAAGEQQLAVHLKRKLNAKSPCRILTEAGNKGHTDDFVQVRVDCDVRPGHVIMAIPKEIQEGTLVMSPVTQEGV